MCVETTVVTELCLLLRATPALRRQTVVREGMPGLEMFLVSSGKLRVTTTMRIKDDTERARQWITEVFAAQSRQIELYSNNQKSQFEELLRLIRKVGRQNPVPRQTKSDANVMAVLYDHIDKDLAVDNFCQVSF